MAAAQHKDRSVTQILVTGGCGFIGSNFIRHLLATDRTVAITNLDKVTYAGNPENLADLPAEQSQRYKFVHGDIVDAGLMSTLLIPGRFDAVIHFASPCACLIAAARMYSHGVTPAAVAALVMVA